MTQEVSKTTAADLLSEVSSVLKTSSATVKGRLKDLLIEKEIVRRVDVLEKAVEKRKEAKKELDKARPDQESFDENGVKVNSFFSKAKLEEKKKAGEKLDRLDKAIDLALGGENPDAWNKLEELTK